MPFGLDSDDDFDEFWEGFGVDNETYTTLLDLYPADSKHNIPASHPGNFDNSTGTQFKRAATLFTDAVFVAPKRLSSRLWVNHTKHLANANLYTYRFDTIPHGIPDYFAVTHFQEVAFVMHNTVGQGFPDETPPYFGADPFEGEPDNYFELAAEMSRRWVGFVNSGVPDYAGSKLLPVFCPVLSVAAILVNVGRGRNAY